MQRQQQLQQEQQAHLLQEQMHIQQEVARRESAKEKHDMKCQMEDITVAFKDQIGTLKTAIEQQDQNMR